MANTFRWLGSRGVYREQAAENPTELLEAARNLGEILGSAGFYEWASTLGRDVLNPEKYLEHIENKLAEFAEPCQDNGFAGSCACPQCTGTQPAEAEEALPF